MTVKRSKKLERIFLAVDALCREEEERYAFKQQGLSRAREYAEKLASHSNDVNSMMVLMPTIWCTHLSKSFAEIAQLDSEVAELANRVRIAKKRREIVEERLGRQRVKERTVEQEKNAATHVEMVLQTERIRLR